MINYNEHPDLVKKNTELKLVLTQGRPILLFSGGIDCINVLEHLIDIGYKGRLSLYLFDNPLMSTTEMRGIWDMRSVELIDRLAMEGITATYQVIELDGYLTQVGRHSWYRQHAIFTALCPSLITYGDEVFIRGYRCGDGLEHPGKETEKWLRQNPSFNALKVRVIDPLSHIPKTKRPGKLKDFYYTSCEYPIHYTSIDDEGNAVSDLAYCGACSKCLKKTGYFKHSLAHVLTKHTHKYKLSTITKTKRMLLDTVAKNCDSLAAADVITKYLDMVKVVSDVE